jgi:hypothetical protein
VKKAGTLSLAVGAVAIGTMALAAPAMAAAPAVHVTPNTGLVNNKVVAVKFSGFSAKSTVIIVQCSKAIASAADATNYCNLKNIKQVKTTTGAGSTSFTVKTGAMGKLGKCVSKSKCVIGAATVTPKAGAFATITFK